MSEIPYNHITIEGNIGAGKTSLAKALNEALDGRLLLESFENNPFLEHFYRDRARYAFQVEMFFLAERYHQLSKNLLGDIFHVHTVSDYLFSKSAIFSSINLSGDENDLFLNLYRIMERFMPRPDILIYLHLPVDLALDQINKRGRSYEANIEKSYLEKVERAYLTYLKEESRFPIVMIEEQHHVDRQLSTTLKVVNEILEKDWPNGLSHYAVKS